jgi:hypothetical protein
VVRICAHSGIPVKLNEHLKICDILPAENHWVGYFKCLFSLSEILYKLEMPGVVFEK